MSAIWIALLALVAIGISVHPLFGPKWRVPTARPINTELENLLSHREATYSTIKDLEFDHIQGKLSDMDYAELRAKYETKALGILEQLQSFGTPLLRSDTQPLHLPKSGCPHCSEPYEPDDKFCRICGTAFASLCQACGTPVGANDKFCARCGSPNAVLVPA